MKYAFEQRDFSVFNIDGLDSRMSAIKEHTRPKLNALGEYFKDYLTELTGDEHFFHVAQHARRKVNPPDDTWVSFSTNKRGYKMMPHFQIGLFNDHVFCMYGVIYESPTKKEVAQSWLKNIDVFDSFPKSFQVSLDHMKPKKTPLNDLSKDDLEAALERTINVKKGEFLIGKVYSPNDEALKSDVAFKEDLEKVMLELFKLYK